MQCVTAKWWINISILKRCVALDTLESKQLVMFKTLEVSTPCAAWTSGCSDECQGNFLKGPCSICYQSFGMHLGVKSIFLANCSRNNCKNPFTITEKIVPSHLWITGESCTLSQREGAACDLIGSLRYHRLGGLLYFSATWRKQQALVPARKGGLGLVGSFQSSKCLSSGLVGSEVLSLSLLLRRIEGKRKNFSFRHGRGWCTADDCG